MPRQKKNSPAKSPSPFRGESPPGVSQDSGADTGAADAAPLLPNPRAEAQDLEAPALSFGSAVQPILDPPSGAGAFVANDSSAGQPGSFGARSLLPLLDPSQPSASDLRFGSLSVSALRQTYLNALLRCIVSTLP